LQRQRLVGTNDDAPGFAGGDMRRLRSRQQRTDRRRVCQPRRGLNATLVDIGGNCFGRDAGSLQQGPPRLALGREHQRFSRKPQHH
jgi:hypothetical protein